MFLKDFYRLCKSKYICTRFLNFINVIQICSNMTNQKAPQRQIINLEIHETHTFFLLQVRYNYTLFIHKNKFKIHAKL